MIEETMPRPRGICDFCQVAGAAIQHHSGRWFLYCEHNRTAGVLEPEPEGGRRWTLFTPVTREDFVDQMQDYADRFAQVNGAPPAGPLN